MSEVNDSIHAQLSNKVYRNPDIAKVQTYDSLPEGWEPFMASGNHDNHEGFFGAAFKNDNNIIIAYRGTHNPLSEDNKNIGRLKNWGEFAKDLDDNLAIWRGKVSDQYHEALKFANKVISATGKNSIISCTGHSAGAGLCELVSIAINKESVAFDSPGVLDTARKLFTIDQINSAKIKSYAAAPNFINTSGKHIKTPIQLKFDTNIDGVKGEDYFNYSLNQHRIELILNQFDPITGDPKSIITRKEWPSSGYDYYISEVLKNAKQPYVFHTYSKEQLIKLGVEPYRIIEEDISSGYQGLYTSGVSSPEIIVKVLPKYEFTNKADATKDDGSFHKDQKDSTTKTSSNDNPSILNNWFDLSNYGMPLFRAEYIKNYVNQIWPPSSLSPSNDNAKPKSSTKHGDTNYKVEPGDSVWSIAQKYETTVEAILLLPGNEKFLDRIKYTPTLTFIN